MLQSKRNLSSNLIRFLSLTLCAAAMLVPVDSMASLYDCITKQAFIWKHGRLDSKTNLGHVVLRFDDDSGILWWSFNSDSPSETQAMKILQKKIPGFDLTATSENEVNKHNVGDTIFRISDLDEKTVGLTFIFYEPVRNDILTGTCHIEKSNEQ